MPALPMPSAPPFLPAPSLRGRVTGEPDVDRRAADRELSFRGSTVHARAEGGFAVVVVTQRFVNPHAEPLSVHYTLPLPHDAAVRGYAFRVGDRVMRGVVDGRQQARERFEQAVASGRTAGLLDQERSTVFRQELGNLPPGQELEAVIEFDQRLLWIDDGSWEWRFPTVVAPRYLGAAGRVADADALSLEVSEAPLAPRVSLELHVLDALTGKVTSSTHALTTLQGEGLSVQLREDGTRLDRDIAVRWPVGQARVGVGLRVARSEHPGGGAHGLVTIVPPTASSQPRALPRDLILLVDASGSMHGAPLQQSKELMRSLVGSLAPGDRLEMISFGNLPRRWQGDAVVVTPGVRHEALRWIDRLQAEGGTEMRAGILESMRTLRDGAQRQVVLITDGLIGFEAEIVRTLHEALPAGCRLHTVGVGSSINRSLTGPAARAGAGVEILLDLDGDVAEATRRLLARTVAPLVTELVIAGDAVLEHAPARLPDLFAGAPLLVSLRLRESGGSLQMRGRTPDGPWSAEVAVPSVAPGEGPASLRALFGRERVEDLEVLWATGREQGAIDRQIEQTGVAYQIATRLTSWVAVSDEPTVRPGTAQRHEVVPHELPHGLSAVGLGLRAPLTAMPAGALEDDDDVMMSLAVPRARSLRAPAPAAQRPVPVASRPMPPAGFGKRLDLKTRLASPSAVAPPPAEAAPSVSSPQVSGAPMQAPSPRSVSPETLAPPSSIRSPDMLSSRASLPDELLAEPVKTRSRRPLFWLLFALLLVAVVLVLMRLGVL